MPSYTLEFDAIGLYLTDIPTLEIWTDGVLNSSHLISQSGSTISLTINHPGPMPASLSFGFNDPLIETGRSINISNMTINGRHINEGNYLSSGSLVQGGTSSVAMSSSNQFLFDSSEPDPSEFTPVTAPLTNGDDTVRDFNETDDLVYDALDGRDVIYMGSGDDKVNGGAGKDILRGGDDIMNGGDDNDSLSGDTGNDILYGDAGGDQLFGMADDDTLHGGSGLDGLTSGDGADTFVFTQDSAYTERDVVRDFDGDAGDALDLSDLISGFNGLSIFLANYVNFVEDGDDTIVQVDGDGLLGGSNFQDVTLLEDVTGLNEITSYLGGDLII